MMKLPYLGGLITASALFLPMNVPASPADRNKFVIFVVSSTDEELGFFKNDVAGDAAVTSPIMSTDTNDTLKSHIDTIKSFLTLVEDEELSPVTEYATETGLALIKNIQQESGDLPYFIAPTRSSGILIDYRKNGLKVHYWIDRKGNVEANVMKDNKSVNKALITDDYLPTPSDLIPV